MFITAYDVNAAKLVDTIWVLSSFIQKWFTQKRSKLSVIVGHQKNLERVLNNGLGDTFHKAVMFGIVNEVNEILVFSCLLNK